LIWQRLVGIYANFPFVRDFVVTLLAMGKALHDDAFLSTTRENDQVERADE